MTTEAPDTGQLAEAFHTAFVVTYTNAARQKYPKLATRLAFHGQDVHVIHGGNRFWHILCLPGQRYGDVRLGPVGRFTLQAVNPGNCPDLADLPDHSNPRKEEFRLSMNVDFFIYHEAVAPPWPTSDAALVPTAIALAERMVDEHAAPYLEVEALKSKTSLMRNAHQLEHDISEAFSCLVSEHYRAAIVTICASCESAIVGRLEDMGHPIRQEERARVLGHEFHSVYSMVNELYRAAVITSKTRERMDILNGLRRGSEHCRPDADLKDDADYAWQTLLQLLRELTK
jgi:hypothetical protein